MKQTPELTVAASVAEMPAAYAISRYKSGRYFAVHDPGGELVCLTVYRKGAAEVVKRLQTPGGKEDTR